MKRIISLIFKFLFFVIVLFSACKQNSVPTVITDGPEVISFRALPFQISDVKLLDGPFKHATELNEQSLLNYEPDRFLAKFRIEAGLEPKAENYHGWEDETLAGHSLGHYLSAICMMFQTTGNEEFARRANYIVDQLAECQNADDSGYIGAFKNGKKIFEEQVAKGDIRSHGFDLNGLWSPFYTMHKVMAGLNDAYELCGNEKALEVNLKFADWIYSIINDLNDEQIQEMLNCEYGGINEELAELYAETGDQKYLRMAHVLHHKVILDSLAHQKDILAGKHANTQIPKVIGEARLYELTGDKTSYKIAEFFWKRVVEHHSYVTGGNGDHEYFGPPDTLRNRLSNETTESCNVYNMLKLSKHLFMWEASPKVADFYERALFNHILSSQHPENGHVIYNLSLEMGGFKVYQNPEWFTCCVGSGMENHSKYSLNIYYRNNEELFVNQFIASELNWKEKGLKLRQETQYPEGQGTAFEFTCEKPVNLTLQIRYPYWAKNGVKILVNGEPSKITQSPQNFVAIHRNWQTGDRVEVEFPFSLRLEHMPDDSNRVALMYGPLVMAGDLGPENDPKAADPMYVPVLMVDDRNPEEWITPLGNESNTFITNDVGRPMDVTFRPFYTVHNRNYSVYFDLFDQAGWKKYQTEYEAKQAVLKKLNQQTVDYFELGEMQPERDHNFRSEKTWTEEFKHKKYREADRGGWFAFDMRIKKGVAQQLVFEYYGGFPGGKTFDILVNGYKIVTENISNVKPGEFFYAYYNLPINLVEENEKISVKLLPHEGHRAGPLFSARTVISDFK